MNKKALKYVLVVSGIVLLLGLGIWGYKYIKNRNDDKKTNESENDLKELAKLTALASESLGDYTLKYYYNGPIDVTEKTNGEVKCLLASTSSCHKFNYYLTIYAVNNVQPEPIKLKSSWMFYSFEYNRITSSDSSYIEKVVTPKVINSKFLIISLSNYIHESYNNSSKTYYPYTKVFDATTGDMIFAVPTNSNETITITGTIDGISGRSFKNNMYLVGTSAIYYLKSNYNLTDENNVEIHKVEFDDNYDKKYKDTIYAYTKGTIKTRNY